MGSDKASLSLAGRSLLSRALDLAGAVSREVRIVGDPQKFSAFGTVVPDIYLERGPLGGTPPALTSSAADCKFILALALPFLEARFLHYLVAQAQSAGTVVTVPSAGGH